MGFMMFVEVDEDELIVIIVLRQINRIMTRLDDDWSFRFIRLKYDGWMDGWMNEWMDEWMDKMMKRR